MNEYTSKRPPPRVARYANTVAARVAGKRWFPLWAVIEHRGRKSGTAYRTPVAILAATGDAFYVPLPWGRGTDWVRNLRAGDGSVVWKGVRHRADDLDFAGKDEALPHATAPVRPIVRRMPLTEFLRIGRTGR